MKNASIQFGSKEILFQVSFSDRKTLGITVTPEMDVLVKAPLNTPIDKIREVVRKRAAWIIRQQSYFLAFYPRSVTRKYTGGESHLYMGRNYQLKVILAKVNRVSYKGRYLEVMTNDKAKVKELLLQWYEEHAKQKFPEIAKPLIERFKRYHVEPKGIYMLAMKKRWGSCTAKGKIILNTELIKAPKGCIEYVIIHELCHLVHHNHTNRFIELQTKEMPDWEKWKNKLETLLA